MSDVNRELLNEAIARNCALVLSLPSAGLLRHHKSRFLGEVSTGLWVEAVAEEKPLIEELLNTRAPIGISFKSATQKVVFASAAISFDLQYRINEQTIAPALLLAFPVNIKVIQRRSNYRVRVFAGLELRARVWRIAPRAYLGDRPPAALELAVNLRDLSVGGVGVTFLPKSGEGPKVSTEDRLRVEIAYGEIVILLEGRMRNPSGPQPQAGINSGIPFKEMGDNLEGRQKLSQLTRIIGAIQREEVRRARLGIA